MGCFFCYIYCMKRNTLLLLLVVFICPLVYGEQTNLGSLNLETAKQLNDINLKVNKLIIENDSLKSVVNSIKIEDYKSLDVISKVHNFYDSSWNKLIWFVSIIGGVFAFVWPYYLSAQQKKELQLNKDDFKNYVDNKVIESEIVVKRSNKTEINNSLVEFEKEMNKSFASIKTDQSIDISKLYAMTYFLQATRFYKDGKFLHALKSYSSSLKYQIASKSNKQIAKTLHNITNSIGQVENNSIPIETINKIHLLSKMILDIYEDEYALEIENIRSQINKP